MAYTPTNWQNGDVVTAEKMNKLENGVTNADKGALVVNVVDSVLDKTWQEIHDAFVVGTNIIVHSVDESRIHEQLVMEIAVDSLENLYMVGTHGAAFIANSANGYPIPAETAYDPVNPPPK